MSNSEEKIQNQCDKNWDAINKEVNAHIVNCMYSMNEHWLVVRRYECWDRRISLLLLVLTLLVSSELLAPGDFLYSLAPPKIKEHLLPLSSFFVSLLTAIKIQFKHAEKSILHGFAANEYLALSKQLTYWSTQYPTIGDVKAAKEQILIYRERIIHINQKSPDLPEWAYKKYQKQLDKDALNSD